MKFIVFWEAETVPIQVILNLANIKQVKLFISW